MKTTTLSANVWQRDSSTQAVSHVAPAITRTDATPTKDSHFVGGYWIAAVVAAILLTGWHRRRRRAAG